MVGMVVYGEISEEACVVHHLMIDRRYQGEGLGKATLLGVLERLRSSGSCREARLSYWPGNPAVRLYEWGGFEHTGERWNEEPVMVLPL